MRRLVAWAAIGAPWVAVVSSALCAEEKKPPAITQGAGGATRQILQKFDVPGTDYEFQLIRVEFAPNLDVPRHSHPGPEASFVLEGEADYIFDGQAPQKRVAGESITLPGYAIHGAKAGPKGVVLLNSYVLEKGKPLVIPAPAQKPSQ